jgi:hypothetical protein
MAVKKTTKKTTKKIPKKTVKKTAAKKKPAKKKATAKKTGAKKKAAPKRAATAEKTTAKSKAAPASKPIEEPKEAKKTKGKFSATNVNLGHVFLLRPKVSTSFRHADFRTARHLLSDESYASLEEAARAVAEKALELTHEAPSKRDFRPGR